MTLLEPNRALVRLQTDMRNARGLASGLALAASTLAWSPPAAACGLSAVGATAAVTMAAGLLIVLLISLVSLLSMRAAVRAVGRMRRVRDSRGLWVGHVAAVLGLVIASASTVVSGGLFLAFALLLY